MFNYPPLTSMSVYVPLSTLSFGIWVILTRLLIDQGKKQKPRRTTAILAGMFVVLFFVFLTLSVRTHFFR